MRERLLRNEKLPRQVSSSFDQLKEYLAEHQQNSVQTTEQSESSAADRGERSGLAMVYYALPFVPAPHLHPELKHIFSSEWVSELRKDTLNFTRQLCANMGKQPRYPFIYSLIEGPVVPFLRGPGGAAVSGVGNGAGGANGGANGAVGGVGGPAGMLLGNGAIVGAPLGGAAAAQLLGVHPPGSIVELGMGSADSGNKRAGG